MGIFRFFSSSSCCQNVSKSALALLRKKTGYTLGNIRKALELHNNDTIKAEEWLKEQAKALGWSAANKLQNREVTQGLIGIAFDQKKLAMVELNCETDFVSRNDKFRSLVSLVAKTCLQQPVLNSEVDTSKVYFNSEELGKLKPDKDSLADHLALVIGSLGENMVIKRGFCYETKREDISLAVAVHPPPQNPEVLLGKYGSFVSFMVKPKELENGEEITVSGDVGNQLCRHIIGMNPTKIGEFRGKAEEVLPQKDEPRQDKLAEEEIEGGPSENELNENQNNAVELVNQDFLFDPSITVGEFLKKSGVTVLDFQRFECGRLEADGKPCHNLQEKKEGVNVALG